jgi:hypothetical protein
VVADGAQALDLQMIRGCIAHVSLCAMLLHLALGHCALHLPACEAHGHHGHHHADEPAHVPAHDDCHESHSSAVVSQAVAAPPPPDTWLHAVPPAAADAALSSSGRAELSAFLCNGDPARPLPLRAHLRLGVLLN